MGRIGTKRLDGLVKYGLIIFFLCLALPWETFPHPLSALYSLDTGAGVFFETRVFFWIGVLFLTLAWFLRSFREGFLTFKRTDLDFPFLLFLITALLSLLKSANLHASLDSFLVVLGYFLFYWLVVNHFKTSRDINLFILALLIAGGLLALYGIHQYLAGFKMLIEYARERQILIDTPNRVFAIFISPNHLACFLIMLIPLSFALLINAEAGLRRVFLLVVSVVMITCLFFTYSRGGWLCFLLVAAVMALGIPKEQRYRASLSLLVVVVLVTLTSSVITRSAGEFSPETAFYGGLAPEAGAESALGRFYLWRGTLELIRDFPITGSGIGTFASIYPRYQYGGIYSKHAHDVYLEVFAETGILGISALLAAFFLLARRELLLWRRSKENRSRGLALALFAGTSGFLVHSVIDFHWQVPLLGLTLMTIAALSFCPAIGGVEEVGYISCRKVSFSGFRFFVALVLGLFLLGVILTSYRAHLFSDKGKSLLKEGRFGEAVQVLEKAVNLDPLFAPHQSRLAEAYFEGARRGEGMPVLSRAIYRGERAVSLEPYSSGYQAKLGFYYWAAGRLREAEEAFMEGRDLYPNDPYFPVLLGEFYFTQGRHQLAITEFRRAIDLKKYYTLWYPERGLKNIARAHYDLGLLHREIGNLRQAAVEFREVLELEPRNEEARKGLVEIEEDL
ncbi:MAG TPA: hypothetical protein DCW86_04145 [Actinobacteria bacterium]|nr:hypothetical protein [Actinomycetota bacterium]